MGVRKGPILCGLCSQPLSGNSESCTYAWISFDDSNLTRYPRIPHEGKTRCPDCGVLPGAIHHEICMGERCSRCGLDFFQCQCRRKGITYYTEGAAAAGV